MKDIITRTGQKFKVLTGKDICDQEMTEKTKKYIDDLMVIDTECYGGEDKGEDCIYVGDASGYYNRFGYVESENGEMHLDESSGCIDNIIAVADENDRIIGYINYLTMGEALFNEIIHPDIPAYMEDPSRRDDGIVGEQLKQWDKNSPNHLFILSVTIAKEYQNTDIVKIISSEFRQELAQKEAEGYHVDFLGGDTVSDHGEHFLSMLCGTAAKGADGTPLILPAPESDESGHDVTVVTCDVERLIKYGFDFSKRPILEPLPPVPEQTTPDLFTQKSVIYYPLTNYDGAQVTISPHSDGDVTVCIMNTDPSGEVQDEMLYIPRISTLAQEYNFIPSKDDMMRLASSIQHSAEIYCKQFYTGTRDNTMSISEYITDQFQHYVQALEAEKFPHYNVISGDDKGIDEPDALPDNVIE